MAPYWFPVVTLILGAVAGYLVDALREGRVERRQRQQARRDFQRDTLVELQEWLAKLARATGAIHHHDEMEYRQHGTWGRTLVGEEWDLAEHEAIVNVHRLRVRVADDAIRNGAKEFVSACGWAAFGASGDDNDAAARDRAREALNKVVETSTSLQEIIGERIRSLA